MLYLVHRVTISIKLRPVKLEQAVSESLPHQGLYTEPRAHDDVIFIGVGGGRACNFLFWPR